MSENSRYFPVGCQTGPSVNVEARVATCSTRGALLDELEDRSDLA